LQKKKIKPIAKMTKRELSHELNVCQVEHKRLAAVVNAPQTLCADQDLNSLKKQKCFFKTRIAKIEAALQLHADEAVKSVVIEPPAEVFPDTVFSKAA
jgi:hypothetical protein